ncbi:alpha-L-fucosidase [Renibacterium salmoninarum ATCC 33209]|uniref:Alpha-L-fucosidase n=1 Tax=Renibacterium salmoninarum (strain ATCC 33209 / DSM 20767 / JCM 11484 / NBRC 15589 / NCIMB 2235) TaxID=288705 RepID=A9WV54_RENSM|nr:alpha-L-fucosidase [Renibacterium salmoninarum ATCC 33209]
MASYSQMPSLPLVAEMSVGLAMKQAKPARIMNGAGWRSATRQTKGNSPKSYRLMHKILVIERP